MWLQREGGYFSEQNWLPWLSSLVSIGVFSGTPQSESLGPRPGYAYFEKVPKVLLTINS